MIKKDTILFTIIGILLIYNILSYIKISKLEERLQIVDSMQNELSNVNYSVQDISSQIDMKLTEFVQNQLWIQKKEYQINSVNIEENQIDVVIDWSLRELAQGEKVTLLYREKTEKNWTELQPTQANNLNYRVETSFHLDGNYETQVVATSSSGKRSESLVELPFKEHLNQRITTDAFVHQAGEGQMDINIYIQNTVKNEFFEFENNDQLKIQSAKAQLFFDGKSIKQWDLLKEQENLHYISDSYNESINYNTFIDLKENVGKEIGDVKLLVTLKDGYGITYETEGISEGSINW
ncbi:hypothetical protein FS935_19600 [Metabacillus litoralis]|uniref:Uncharacterized protein n=1 Tax=Metabacillus litoralis TaxID=152268 RepID=A0A5C6VLG2_9BACI|nr:hypothetical protein [Metabacillus litoralis]TXC85850.1 hypothetical protein FS935_19600 [Metabacillus litoralis]